MIKALISIFQGLGLRLSPSAHGGSTAAGSNTNSTVRRASVSNEALGTYDKALLFWLGALLLIGLVMVYSATVGLPDAKRFELYKPTHFVMRHAFAIALGIGAAFMVYHVPPTALQRMAMPLFIAGMVLLILVLIPGIGKVVYGARRWIPLGILNLQPAELMKIFVVLYAADFIVRRQSSMHSFRKGFLPLAIAVGIVGALLLLQPDLGSLVVLAAIAMGLLFLGGLSLRWFVGLGGMITAVFAIVVWSSPWRRERIFAYLDPFEENNVVGKGYQVAQSLMAFGRGEFFGVGLGGSVGKLHYLPEAHTDFILAVIGEELGLVGVLIVIWLFYKVTLRAFEIGRQAVVVQSAFTGLVATGIGIWIAVQSIFNMGVNLGLLPTKGLTLPFMSYGGSGILFNCIAIGILMRIDVENRRMMRGGKA